MVTEMIQTVGEPTACLPYEDDVCFAVVDAVSAVTGDAPAEIGPLNDTVDPDALDRLFGPTDDGRSREGGRLQFPFEGLSVVIDGAQREVRIYE